MADKSFPSHCLELDKEAFTQEFSEGTTSVLLGTLSHSIYYTSAMHLVVFSRHVLGLRVSKQHILEDFNWAATLVLRVHIIVGVASNGQQFTIAELNFGSYNF